MREFTARLALTEVFEAYGRPQDFPFPSEVAGDNHRERCLVFLRKWWRDRDLAQAYVRLSGEIETTHRLDHWAERRAAQSHAFRHLAVARWEKALSRLSAVADSKEGALSVLSEMVGICGAEAQGFWEAQAGQFPGWASLQRLAGMTVAARRAVAEAASASSPADFVIGYAQHWHKVDREYWTLTRDVRARAGLEVLANVADLFYAEYAVTVNGRFYDSLLAQPAWPTTGGTTVQDLARNLWSAQGSRAILLVDALRYDLAVELQTILPDFSTEVRPILANVPTETAIGMSSLLPGGGRGITATVSDAGIEVRDGDSGLDLRVRGNRDKILQERVKATCFDLDSILARDKRPQPLPSRMVVTEAGVDDIGHTAGGNLIDHFDALLRKLRHAVEKLARWGYADIQLVTDHGFLLFRRLPEAPRIPIQEENCLLVGRRYAVLRPGVPPEHLSIPFPFAPEHRLAFPRGVRCFKAPAEYMHEGLTLQEAVIPHVVIRVPLQVRRIGIEVQPRMKELSIGTFKLDVVPVAPPQPDLYAPQASGRTLHVFLTAGDQPATREKTVEVPAGATDPIPVTLFVHADVRLRIGTELSLVAEDVETRERFVGKVTILVTRDF